MEDIAKSVTEEMSALKIGLHDDSGLSLNRVKFDSYDSELRDHELKCLVHHDKLVMVKRALKLWKGQATKYGSSISGGYRTASGPCWEEALRYKVLHIKSCTIPTKRSVLIDSAEVEAKAFAYETLDENGWKQPGHYSGKIYREIHELKNRRISLVEKYKEQSKMIMSDPLKIAEFVRSQSAVDARTKQAAMIEDLERQEEFLNKCHSSKNHFTFAIKQGERNHELYKLYSEHLKKSTKEIDKYTTRLERYIKKLEKSAPQDYDSFKADIMAEREKVKLAEEKAKLAEEKKKQAEEAKKRKSEKKAFEVLTKQLSLTGLGLGELASNGEEKRAYTTEAEAQKAAITSSGKSGQYITVYSKNFRLLDGTSNHGKTYMFWFLTSNKSVTKAA